MLGSLVAGGWVGIVAPVRLPLVVWLHACIGLHFAWRLRPWYRDWLPVLYAVALLVPAAGIGGAAIALRDFAELAQQPGFLRDIFEQVHAPDAEGAAALYMIADSLAVGAVVLLLAGLRRPAGARLVGAPRRRGSPHLWRAPGRSMRRPASASWR